MTQTNKTNIPSESFFLIGQVITNMINVRRDKGRISWEHMMGNIMMRISNLFDL